MHISFFSWFFKESPTTTRYTLIPDSLSVLFDKTSTDLDLSDQTLSDTDFQAIVKKLHSEKHGIIKSIDLSGNRITGVSNAWLGQLLEDFPELEKLDLSYNHLWGDEAIKRLAWMIKRHPNLTTLKIGGNKLGPERITSLAELFLASKVTTIDIG